MESQKLEQVIEAIQRQWGDQALRKLENVSSTSSISTGFPALDALLGKGGIPRGTLTCLWGTPTAGMTTLVLNTLSHVQDSGEVAVYLDLDRTFDAEYAVRRGIELQKLLVVRPQSNAVGLDIIRDIVGSGGAGAIVLDTGMSVPKPADQGGYTAAIRRVRQVLKGSAYALLAIVPALPDALGKAVMNSGDVRLRVTWCHWVQQMGTVTGYEAHVTVLKNKFGPPDVSTTISVTLGGRGHAP